MSKSAMENGKYIALTNQICPVCGRESAGDLLINTRFQDISELHGKATHFGDPCEECQKSIDSGAIMIIVGDQSKSGQEFKDLYRTGEIYGIREEAIRNMLKDSPKLEQVLKDRVMVMDYKDAKAVGLPVKYGGIDEKESM